MTVAEKKDTSVVIRQPARRRVRPFDEPARCGTQAAAAGMLVLLANLNASEFPLTESDSRMTVTVEQMTDCFLEGVQQYAVTGQLQKARVAIFRYTNDLLQYGQFQTVNKMLSSVNTSEFPPQLLLTIVTASSAAPPDSLPSRETFFLNVKKRFKRELGDEQAEALLDALK